VPVTDAFFSLAVSPARAQSGSLDVTFNPDRARQAFPAWRSKTNGQVVIAVVSHLSTESAAHLSPASIQTEVLDTTFDPGRGTECCGKLCGRPVQWPNTHWRHLQFLKWCGMEPARPPSGDGSVDTSFDTSSADDAGANGAVSALALQADGRVLIGGSFNYVSGTNCSGIARLNTNGALDVTLISGPSKRSLWRVRKCSRLAVHGPSDCRWEFHCGSTASRSTISLA